MTDAARLLKDASRNLLAPEAADATLIDRAGIERILPHRGASLLLDSVVHLDRGQRLLVADYDLAQAGATFAGHFPGHPLWPGLLQVEAIGQAGMALARIERPKGPGGAITDVLGARFLGAVRPPGRVRIVARVQDDDPFEIVIGQCLFEGAISCAAVLRGLETEGFVIPSEGG